MKIIRNLNVLELFIVSILMSGLLLVIETFTLNRLSSNVARMSVAIICDILAIPLFIQGASKSFKMNYSAWAVLNIIAIIVIVVWTVWVCLVLYAFKEFHLVIPA